MRVYELTALPFLAVFEQTKLGWPHLHIVCRVPWIDQRWLSAQMDKAIGAPIVDIRRIANLQELAGYVAKYIGKDPHHFEGTKRYWKSKDYDLRSPFEWPDKPTWQRRTIDIRAWITEQQLAGYHAWCKSPTEAFAVRPP
jgi:hypothetical protein